jgi:hypothetical protein
MLNLLLISKGNFVLDKPLDKIEAFGLLSKIGIEPASVKLIRRYVYTSGDALGLADPSYQYFYIAEITDAEAEFRIKMTNGNELRYTDKDENGYKIVANNQMPEMYRNLKRLSAYGPYTL